MLGNNANIYGNDQGAHWRRTKDEKWEVVYHGFVIDGPFEKLGDAENSCRKHNAINPRGMVATRWDPLSIPKVAKELAARAAAGDCQYTEVNPEQFAHRMTQAAPYYMLPVPFPGGNHRTGMGFLYEDMEAFAIFHVYEYGGWKAKYFRMELCRHEYDKVESGNCYSREVCLKCGHEFVVDSSG